LLLHRSFFSTAPATSWFYPLSLHDALPISGRRARAARAALRGDGAVPRVDAARRRRRRMAGVHLGPATGVALLRAHHRRPDRHRSEEHTSELQSLRHLVCRLLLEKKKKEKK